MGPPDDDTAPLSVRPGQSLQIMEEMEDVHPDDVDEDSDDGAEEMMPMHQFMQNMANLANPFMAMGGPFAGPLAMMGPHFVGGGGIPFAPFNFDVDEDSDDGVDEMMPMQMFHQGKKRLCSLQILRPQ